MAPPPACNLPVAPCFRSRPVSLKRLFPLKSCCRFPPFLQVISSESIAVLALGLLSCLHAPAPSCHAPSVDVHPGTGYVGPRLGLSVWFSLYSDCHGSAASPSNSPKCFPFCPNWFLRMWESLPLLQLPQRFLSSSFSFLSFVLPRYVSIHKILSSGQGLLLVFRPCSVRTVASIDVFLIHPWREMCPISTYFSAVLSPSLLRFWIDFQLL